MGLAAMYYRINGGKIPSGNNQSASSAGESTTSSGNTNLLSGKEGDSVNVSTNPELSKLQEEQALYEGEQRLLEADILSLNLKLEMSASRDGGSDWSIGGGKVDDKSNKEAEEIKKTIETKQARLATVNKKLEEIKLKIEALKTEDVANSGDDATEGLDDTQKAEIIKQKELDLEKIENKIRELKAKQAELSYKLNAENNKALPDKQTVLSLSGQIQQNGSQLIELLEKEKSLKSELAALKGEDAGEADSVGDASNSVSPDKADDSSIDEKIKDKRNELNELRSREKELLAKGKLTHTNGSRFPTIEYDEETKKELIEVQNQIKTIQRDILSLEAQKATGK